MKVLAIETSCDETGIAVVEGEKTPEGFVFKTLKNALLSQAQLHAQYGGVYPNLAKREHLKNLPILFKEFEDDAVDAIAVTQGPGLEPALWTGIEFAKKLASERGLPLLPTNHMEGHLTSSLAQREHSNILENVRMILKDVQLPVLALLVSGGHTEFVLMREWFKYEIIGQTLDDAVGEAFDKVARMLGLPYPGGPHISKLAAQARTSTQTFAPLAPSDSRTRGQSLAPQTSATNEAKRIERGLSSATARELSDFSAEKSRTSRDLVLQNDIKLPRPMIDSGTCDVSFSGLKTAALYALRDMGGIQKLNAEQIADFAREFEDAAADVFVAKTRRALEQTDAQTFVIGGGVAANTHLRERLQNLVTKEFPHVDFRLPELSITGDNAIMIAQAALARALSGLTSDQSQEIRAVGNLSIAS